MSRLTRRPMAEISKAELNHIRGAAHETGKFAAAPKKTAKFSTISTSRAGKSNITEQKADKKAETEEKAPTTVPRPIWKSLGSFYETKKPTRVLARKPVQAAAPAPAAPVPAAVTTPSSSRSASSTAGSCRSNHSQMSNGSFESGAQFSLLESTRIFNVNNHPYLVLQKIGKGGSSKVYKVMAPDMSIYALKRVDISQQQPAAIESFINEIDLLKMLQGSERIISLKEAEVDRAHKTISIVLELGDIDLRSLIEKNRTEEAIDPNFLRLMWQQMLEAVQVVHDANVVHGDLKPANFLFVSGTLKLIDFGIAKTIAVEQDTTNIERPNQAGTLNYMSPESLKINDERKAFKVGRAADVWSLGCILYQLVYNNVPFPQNNWIQRLQAIVSDSYQIEFPEIPDRPDSADLLSVMKACLQRDPKKRPKIDELLHHPYVTFRNPDYALIERQLLDVIIQIQDYGLDIDFESERDSAAIVRRIADQIRRGEPVSLFENM